MKLKKLDRLWGKGGGGRPYTMYEEHAILTDPKNSFIMVVNEHIFLNRALDSKFWLNFKKNFS